MLYRQEINTQWMTGKDYHTNNKAKCSADDAGIRNDKTQKVAELGETNNKEMKKLKRLYDKRTFSVGI